MAGGAVTRGNRLPIVFKAWDQDPGLFIRAFVFDNNGNQLSGSPIDLTHLILGGYQDDTLAQPAGVQWTAAYYIVYKDAAHTIFHPDHTDDVDIFPTHDISLDLTNLETLINNLLNQARADAVINVIPDEERVAKVIRQDRIKVFAEPDKAVSFKIESEDDVKATATEDDDVTSKTED